MSYLGGIGRGRGPVPPAPNAQNRELQKPGMPGSVIKSAKWGRGKALPNESVPIQILLNKPAQSSTAAVEIMFNVQGGQPVMVDNPMPVRITGLTAIGQWRIKTPKGKDPFKGYYSFRVKLNGETVNSDALTLTNDPVARVVSRINTDGFDR